MTTDYEYQVDQFDFRISRRFSTEWDLSLPHQCSGWEINPDYQNNTSRQEAIEDLKLFIKRASEALTVLESLSDNWKGSWSTLEGFEP